MTKITYLDPNDDAPKITWQGVVFRAHQATEVRNKQLIEDAKNHPYFKVADDHRTAHNPDKTEETDKSDQNENGDAEPKPAPKPAHKPSSAKRRRR
jgi:galactose mutarotase-like enzyme